MIIACFALTPAARAQEQFQGWVDEYRSGEASITVEGFAPLGRGPYPVIVMLHGAGGMDQDTSIVFRESAADLAARGYVVLIPHYFQRTGHVPGTDRRPGEYDEWQEAVEGAIQYAATVPVADANTFGLVGYSLGGALAQAVAAQDRDRIKAIALISSVPSGSEQSKPLPTMVLYGSRDQGMPRGEEGKAIENRYTEANVALHVHRYKGAAHNFDGKTFLDATRRASKFFDTHVKGQRPPAPRPARERTKRSTP